MKNVLRFILFASIGFAVLYYIFYTQQRDYEANCVQEQCSFWAKILEDFSKVNFMWVGVTVICYLCSNICRSLRWQILAEPLGVLKHSSSSLASVFISYLVNLTIPRSGEIARASALAKYENISFERSVGTIVIERVVDMLTFLLIAILTIILAYKDIFEYISNNLNLNDKFNKISNLSFSLLILAAGFIVLFVIYKKYREQILKSKIGAKILSIITGIGEGLKSVLNLKRPGLFFIYSILIWVMYFLMAYFMFKAFPPVAHLSYKVALVVLFFGTLGFIFPMPAGMGSYHFFAMQSLGLYGINGSDAFTYANLNFFTIQIFCNIFFGTIAFIWLAYNKPKV
ncbi:MAG: hypothetical protein RLZZ546_1120 [Bacteroidota bacterium]|jgi:uncharacterized protein (TIRG00374 family)